MVSFFPIYPGLIYTERSGPGPCKLEILTWSFSPTQKVLKQTWSISPSQTVLEQIWSISPASSRSTLAAAAVAACVVLRDLGLDIGASSLGRGTAEAGAGQHPSDFLAPLSQLRVFLGLIFWYEQG